MLYIDIVMFVNPLMSAPDSKMLSKGGKVYKLRILITT